MVYGSGERKEKVKGSGCYKFVLCAFIALAAVAIKLLFPQTVNIERVSALLAADWNIPSLKETITKTEEIKQLAKDLFNAVFNKEVKSEEPAKPAANLSVMSVRSYGVRDYLAMTGIGEVITKPEREVFIMPAQGEITSAYGAREHPVTGENSFHTGIDIAVNEGEQVGAVADAVVTDTGSDSVYGNYLVLTHSDGTESFYAHLQCVLVKDEQQVSAGECIALSGSTGLVTGPHLHLEMRINGEQVDPLEYIGKAA